jgi:UDP-N-acetylglucosamine 2-epimerase (non-hydrolysing)
MRVLTVVGTRPEAVKMAPVIQQLQQTENVQSRVCVTAQHREMLDQVLTLFEIQPDIDLNLMTPDQSLAELSAAIFAGLDPVIRDEKPDWLLIQGDTTTVMVAAILAYYNQIRIGHVEAGLRTRDKWQPFPEEINRKIAGVLADLHFAPTKQAQANLLAEGVPEQHIVISGNPVIDALLQVVERPYQPKEPPLSEIPDDRMVILVTAHRRENFGEPFERIFGAIRDLASEYEDRLHIIYPVHLNPNVQEPARRMLADLTNVSLVEPLEYLPMAYWMKRATLILTDSGGLQEEAPALGTPVLVLRERTERPEALEAGTAKLVGSDPARILEEACVLLDDPQAHAAMAKAKNPFGDGHAAERIVHALINYPNSMAS